MLQPAQPVISLSVGFENGGVLLVRGCFLCGGAAKFPLPLFPFPSPFPHTRHPTPHTPSPVTSPQSPVVGAIFTPPVPVTEIAMLEAGQDEMIVHNFDILNLEVNGYRTIEPNLSQLYGNSPDTACVVSSFVYSFYILLIGQE